MTTHMAVLSQIQGQTTTHDCPGCTKRTYCAMDDGKSSSACWCMTVVPKDQKPQALEDEKCLCRECLAK